MSFDANETIVARVKKHIVKDPASRWHDMSSRLARWGVYIQGVIALLPAGTLSATQISIIAVINFAAIQGAKLIAEEKNMEPKE